MIGPTFLWKQIPSKTHRFNENNKTLEFLDDYVKICPNDRETELLRDGCVSIIWNESKTIYREKAYCPDCGYQVYRRPSNETIRKVEEDMRRPIGASLR